MRPNASPNTAQDRSRRGFLKRVGLVTVAGMPSSTSSEPLVAADVADGERPILNVKDAPYSAKGDGRTDDTAAINRCIAMAAEQARIYFPPGTYIVSPDVTGYMILVDKKNLELFGADRDESTLKVKNDAGDYIALMTNQTTGPPMDASDYMSMISGSTRTTPPTQRWIDPS